MKSGLKLTVTTRADINILDGYQYYHFKQPGLGDYFLASLKQCFDTIQKNPEIFKVIFNVHRQAKLNKFPYVVIYMINQNEIIITRVFNTHQNPIKKIR